MKRKALKTIAIGVRFNLRNRRYQNNLFKESNSGLRNWVEFKNYNWMISINRI